MGARAFETEFEKSEEWPAELNLQEIAAGENRNFGLPVLLRRAGLWGFIRASKAGIRENA